MRLLLTAIAIVVIFLYCRKDHKVDNDIDAFIQCANSPVSGDSTLIAGRLAGSWQLITQACPMGTLQIPDVRLTFKGGRSYEISVNGNVTSQGNWHFRPWGNGWALEISQPNSYMFGSISLCDKKLVFAGLTVDGCNNYFRRTF